MQVEVWTGLLTCVGQSILVEEVDGEAELVGHLPASAGFQQTPF